MEFPEPNCGDTNIEESDKYVIERCERTLTLRIIDTSRH